MSSTTPTADHLIDPTQREISHSPERARALAHDTSASDGLIDAVPNRDQASKSWVGHALDRRHREPPSFTGVRRPAHPVECAQLLSAVEFGHGGAALAASGAGGTKKKYRGWPPRLQWLRA